MDLSNRHSTVQYRPLEKEIVFGLKVPSSDGLGKVIYTKYSKHSNETNTFLGLGKAGRFGQS